jgi:hypothetical protein
MKRKHSQSHVRNSTWNRPTSGFPTVPRELEKALVRAELQLREGHPEEALATVSRAKFSSPWAVNAHATCLLRMGRYQDAVDVLRGLVLGMGGVAYRQDVPAVFQANFATALLAAGNLSGCLSMLNNIKDQQHPAVKEIRTAIGRWRRHLSPWQKLRWRLGGDLPLPMLDFPLGRLN